MNDMLELPLALQDLLDNLPLSSLDKEIVKQSLVSLINYLETSDKDMVAIGKNVPVVLPIGVDWLRLMKGIPVDPLIKTIFLPKIKADPHKLIRVHSSVKVPNDSRQYSLHDKIDNYLQLPHMAIVPIGSIVSLTVSANNDTRLLLPLKVRFTEQPYIVFKDQLDLVNQTNTQQIKEVTLNQATESYRTQQVLKATYKNAINYGGILQIMCEVFNKRNQLIFTDIINLMSA